MNQGNLKTIEQLGHMELAVSRLYRVFAERFAEERSLWDGLADEEEQHHQWVMTLLESARAGKVRIKEDTKVNAEAVKRAIERVEELMDKAIRGDMDLYEAYRTAYALETSLTEGKAFSLLESQSPKGQPSVCEELDGATSAHAMRLRLRLEELFGEAALEDVAQILSGGAKKDPRYEVAACGLVCSACRKKISSECPGCAENEKATWCKVRSCVQEKGYGSCADCQSYDEAEKCPKFNNFFSRLFGFFHNSDRGKCIRRIKAVGPAEFAREMVGKGRASLPRGEAIGKKGFWGYISPSKRGFKKNERQTL
ncbi:hypothetical protein FDZ71_18105, partial [bacterium]